MDQGPTLRRSHELVSSNLIALLLFVEWTGSFQRIPGLLLVFTGHARAFCANFLRLSTSRSLVNPFSQVFHHLSSGRPHSTKYQNNGTTRNEPRSTWLLVFALQLLGFVSAGLGTNPRKALITAIKRLDCAPACQIHSEEVGAKHLFLALIQSSAC